LKKHLLNPLSHSDLKNIYSGELLSAMSDMEMLSLMIKGSYKGNENFYQWPDFSDERIKNELEGFKLFSESVIKEKMPEYKGGFFTFTAFPDKLSKIYSSSYEIRDLMKPVEVRGIPIFPFLGRMYPTNGQKVEKIWQGTIKSWKSFYYYEQGADIIEVFENGVVLLKHTYWDDIKKERDGKWMYDRQIRRWCKYFVQFVEQLYEGKLKDDEFVNIKVEMSDTLDRAITRYGENGFSADAVCKIEDIEVKNINKFEELKDPEKSSYILRKKIFEFFQWQKGADWDERDEY